VMALVIFFVPEPARGVAAMVRVVRPGGLVAAYAWDVLGGGFPQAALQEEMRAMGMDPPWPPSVDASRIEAMQGLWRDAGLQDVQTRQITVSRTFESHDELWAISLLGSSTGPKIRALPPAGQAALKERMRSRLPAGSDGRITYSARANAVRGRLPG